MYHGAAMSFAHSTGSMCVKCATEDFTIPRRDGDATATRTSKTTIGLVGKATTLQVQLTLLYHFVAVFARLRREIA